MESKLTYKVIGGLLDFYFFAASDLSPLNAVQQFTDLVGHTAATPYWASGKKQPGLLKLKLKCLVWLT
ncbi:hypothetical protein SUGI_0538810 [Cryptomeria japonica]|nr:hypothetical protein SUGI_0538810 [Cryptomeria japonica]